MRLAISQLPREPGSPSLGYATLTRDYAILPMLGRSYWPMLAMLSLPYTGYAHAILCWCFILAYSDSNKKLVKPLGQKLAETPMSSLNRIAPPSNALLATVPPTPSRTLATPTPAAGGLFTPEGPKLEGRVGVVTHKAAGSRPGCRPLVPTRPRRIATFLGVLW